VYLAPVHPFVAAASAPLCLALGRRIRSRAARRALAAAVALAGTAVLAGRYDAALDFSPEIAAAARDAAARAAPGEPLYALDVPLQLVGFYARGDVRRLDLATFAPAAGASWVIATPDAAAALPGRMQTLEPSRPIAVECQPRKACVVAIGAAPRTE
jgi:hypothetical protein